LPFCQKNSADATFFKGETAKIAHFALPLCLSQDITHFLLAERYWSKQFENSQGISFQLI
jgi:hypothetical protein